MARFHAPQLDVPPPGSNVGKEMNRQAIAALKMLRSNGASADEMASAYVEMIGQIVRASKGSWTATPARCERGTHVFIGTLIRNVLVITFDRRIFVGEGKLGPGGFFDVTSLKVVNGRPLYDEPNVNEGTEL